MKKYFSVFLATILTATLLTPAISFADINYNNVIDDMVFNNTNTMTAAQIDAFLNTFPDSCLSTNNGFSAPDVTGYSPSTSFTYGSLVSAGTVISHASQAYGLNPQVLLTTLQKEQGLVKGDGPNIVRGGPDGKDCGALAISASVGYNCPDSLVMTPYSGFTLYAYRGTPITSVSGTCVRKAAYVGFSRQIIIAAWQFSFDEHRSEGQNNWYINKPAWDNSDDLNFCYSQRTIAGGPFYLCPDQNSHANDPYIAHSGQYPIDDIVVTIQNGATAALYNYTPHKHGQQLFSSIFTGWFGLPYANDTLTAHPNGTLVSTGGKIYLIENNTKRWITNGEVFASYGYTWGQVKLGSTGDANLTEGTSIDTLAPGTIFRSDNTPVYVMTYENNLLVKQQISLSAFNSLGYSWGEVVYVSPAFVPSATSASILVANQHPAGTLVADSVAGKVYLLDQTSKRWILGPNAFATNGYSWGKVKKASSADIAIPDGVSINLRQGSMLLSGGIYLVDYDSSGMAKRPVGPWECYSNRLHYSMGDLYNISSADLPPRTTGTFSC